MSFGGSLQERLGHAFHVQQIWQAREKTALPKNPFLRPKFARKKLDTLRRVVLARPECASPDTIACSVPPSRRRLPATLPLWQVVRSSVPAGRCCLLPHTLQRRMSEHLLDLLLPLQSLNHRLCPFEGEIYDHTSYPLATA